MSNQTFLKDSLIALLIFLIVFPTILLTSCSYYTRFSDNNYDFTLEYPGGCEMTEVSHDGELIAYNIYGFETSNSINESSVVVGINIWLDMKTTSENNPQKRLLSNMSTFSRNPNFQLIKTESTYLDGIKGDLVEFTYQQSTNDRFPQKGIWVPVRVTDVIVSRNSNWYEIRISAGENDWKKNDKDIQHIFDSFKWEN